MVDAENACGMVDKMALILNIGGARTDLANMSIRQAVRFSWKKYAGEITRVYRQIVS
jgi:hypothetical protein